MASSVLQPIFRAALLQDGAGLSDGDLLEGFVSRRDGAYFEALVRRHGPMVLGVCRRILRNPHDADDAFQAVFCVLAQRAASVMPRELVGNWLHGVAYRTALAARKTAARRRARERQVIEMPQPGAPPEDIWQELLPVLDRELDRLSAKYRAAVVLCHLEGKTRQEAARQLGVPLGTLSGRLTTAMRLLAKRMRRHGLALSGTALAAALAPDTASAAVPVTLVASTVKAATPLAAGHCAAGIVSAEIAALIKGAQKSLLLAKLKLVHAVVLTIAVIGGGSGTFAYHALATRMENAPPQQLRHETAAKTEQKKPDRELLQGTWIPIASEVDGVKKDKDDPKLSQWKLIFDGDKVTLPDRVNVGYTLDPRKQPKEIDIMAGKKASAMKAIYELRDNIMMLSFKKGSDERPSDFDTKKNESVLIVFERRGKS
jgi:RNA polymerase sigma-70 factor (ECF subfamily)